MKSWTIGAALALGLVAAAAQARDLAGTLAGETRLTAADNPVVVRADLGVPEGSTLWIEAGVELRFAPGASLSVTGDIHALGEKRRPIRFEPLEDGVRWGNVKILGDKDLPGYDGDGVWIPDGGGSRLEYCEFRGAGDVVDENYDGGALYLNGSAPIVRSCVFEGNRAERGGGLVAYNFSTPRIEDCTFEGNEALLDDGGAIYCFFYSDAIVARNFIVRNKAARHGGGIYISVSDPLIRENALIDNSCEGWGGAIYVSSSSPQILDNALFEHTAGERSTGLVFQADCRPTVTGNSLLSGGAEVFGLNLSYDLDVSGNWWGTDDELQITQKIRQRGRGRDKVMQAAPWRDKPPANLLTQPVEIRSLHAMADRAWADTLAFDLVETALARVQIEAVDRNPYAVDQTSAEVSVLERPGERLVLLFKETEKASGIFRARLSIGREHEEHPSLMARVGEHVLLVSNADELVKRLYRVDEARPVVHDLAILSDPDPTHLTQHRVQVRWNYFDLLGNEQQGWQIQVSRSADFARPEMWDSGPQPSSADLRQEVYGGSPLLDGERYHFRMRVQGGDAWSAWREFLVRSDNPEYSFRLNSLPPVPAALSPQPDEILATYRPALAVQAVEDREGDPVRYEFQLAEDEFFQRTVAASDPAVQAEASWTAPLDLVDNRRYFWRVRVSDGFETGEWNPTRPLRLNPVEEPPAAFALRGPTGAIADVRPTFRWDAAVDPDPGSSVRYRLLAGSREDFSNAQVAVEGLEAPEWRPSKEYPNLSAFYWVVEAVDNTGRITRSRRSDLLSIDTTPTVPVALFPEGEGEIRAHETFRIQASSDPWPEDALVYEIQLSGDGDFSKPMLDWRGLKMEDLAATGVDAYPETRLLSDDRRYFWRVRAVDDHGAASEWSKVKGFWFNRRNGEPSLPGELAPAAGAVIREQPVLSWAASSDPDHSDPPQSLSYVVQLSEREDFSGQLIEERLEGGATRLPLGARLGDNRRWFWRVEALDNEAAGSGWTAPRALVVNAAEEAPAPFAILEPADGGRPFELDGLSLSWQAAVDADWNSKVTYDWVLSDSEGFAKIVASGRTAETAARAVAKLTSRAPYWLRVKAVDDTGLETLAAVHRIVVDSHPTAPAPRPLAFELGPQDEISWEAATDPDPDDRVLYRLTLRDAGGRPLVDLADWPGTSATIGRLPGAERLPDDSRLTLALEAVDPHGLTADADTLGFWFNSGNDAPSAPAFDVETAAAVLRTTAPALPFLPGADPDRSDPVSSLRHELQVSASAGFESPRTTTVPAGRTRVEGLELGDDARWHLRLRTIDDEGASSPWSPTLALVINLHDDAPTAPAIATPAPGAELFELDGFELAFDASTDPDVDARLSYRAELLGEGGDVLFQLTPATSPSRIEHPLENGARYRLRVVAMDETGLETPSPERAFHVDSTPSGLTLSGADGQVFGPSDRLGWNPAQDPDPRDRLVYEVQVAASRGFGGAATAEAAGTAFAFGQAASALPENGEGFARVRARDPHGLTGPWSPPLAFVWDAVNEPPVFAGALRPASGPIADNEPTISWSAPSDPDRRPQRLTVVLETAADENFGEILATKRVPAAEGGVAQKLLENEVRFVRAKVVDQDGAESAWCPTARYVVNAREEAPSAPGLRSPADGARLEGEIRFRWSEGEDKDPGDVVSHTLEIEGPAPRGLAAAGGEASLELAPGAWRWRVVARDRTGLESASGWRSLTVPTPPPPPAPEPESEPSPTPGN